MELEVINQILQMVKEFGVTILVVGYFIFKDYKFNSVLLELMGRVNDTLDKLEKIISRE